MKSIRKESQEPYYIGLNVGPTYAAYAVTNTSYNLSRFKGKDMWGVYKYDEAETAEDRRRFRQGRNSNLKEKERIRLLRSYFFDEIQKVEKVIKLPKFFIVQVTSLRVLLIYTLSNLKWS